MKTSARSQKVCVVTERDYIEFMKCPMKAHNSLAERLFHDIPYCSPPTNITKASALPPPGPPPGPLAAPGTTSWSSTPVKICKPDQNPTPGSISQDICSPPAKICKPDHNQVAKESLFHEICSPPTKICKAGAGDSAGPVEGTTSGIVTSGFNIEQSFRRLSCEENNENENSVKRKEYKECLDSGRMKQKENIETLNSDISCEKEINEPSLIKFVYSKKSENITNNHESPWITVRGKTSPHSNSRTKTNKENKTKNPSNTESIKCKSENKFPSNDFTTKFALRLLQNQPQVPQQNKENKERKQTQKQQFDKKENSDKQQGNVKYQWRVGQRDQGQRDQRFQPEWRTTQRRNSEPEWRSSESERRTSEPDLDSCKLQHLLRKRRRSGGKLARAAVAAHVVGAVPQNIPRRVTINSPEEMPSDYGTTPGGTIFSTTPGGTRIIYERKFLMQCRQSPLAKTPPANLPHIPGVTTKDSEAPAPRENGTILEEPEKTDVDDEQFEMDM